MVAAHQITVRPQVAILGAANNELGDGDLDHLPGIPTRENFQRQFQTQRLGSAVKTLRSISTCALFP